MTNETIVTLPKEVAEAMDEIKRKNGEGALRDLPQIYSLIEEGPTSYKTVIDYARSDDNLYFEAVVNGYQVEATPEERVREYFEKASSSYKVVARCDAVEASHFIGRMTAIRELVDILDISVSGVNAK
ncbi:hypothetical protein NGI46_07965 [Peribacillus butanolivorans]|uniref:hypothetical protein n=1 Tax=Peribacillus butanolivorans TaxID=421767 RepID=UPI00207C7800|nr:hypothetical protein [Peribacillus butanolivorans]MCO0597402.1 hypothetical protein [Peribacillus butanolivorans]